MAKSTSFVSVLTLQILIFLLFAFETQILRAQNSPNTIESIDWINDKLKTYSTSEIRIQKVGIEESETNPSVKILSVYDARGSNEVTFLTKMLVNIDYIERISIRQEDDFIAIDITPKSGRSCGLILHQFWGQRFDYTQAHEFIKDDNFSILNFDPLPFIQITLKKSAVNEEIPERIIKSLNNILHINGITLKKDIF